MRMLCAFKKWHWKHILRKTVNLLCVDPCNAFFSFNQIFLRVTEDFAPLKSVDCKQKVPKWFDSRLKNLREKRNQSYNKYKENKNNNDLRKIFRV